MSKKSEKRNKLIKFIIGLIVIVVMIAGTIMGAVAYSIDAETEFYALKGEKLDNTFIIEDFSTTGMVDITTTSNLVDFEGENSTNLLNKKIIKNTAVIIPYSITIPKYTNKKNIQVEIITTDGINEQRFDINVKIVNKIGMFFRDLSNHRNFTWIVFGVSVFIFAIIILLLIISMGGSSRKK